MNLRRLRLNLAFLYGLLSVLSVGTLGLMAAISGTEHSQASAERQVQDRALDISSLVTAGTTPTDRPDAWLVDPLACPGATPAPSPSPGATPSCQNPGDVTPTGATKLEPPVKEIGGRAVATGSSQLEHYRQGADYLLYARAIPGTNLAVVVAASLAAVDSDVTTLRLRIALAAIVVVAVTSAAGFWLAGRSLRPARRALEQQRSFITDAAHELRTPLAIIQASASQTLARERSAAEYVNSLQEIREATARANESVSELLDLARLDAGRAEPRRARLRLDLLAEEVATGAGVEGCTVTADAAEPIVVDADPALLRQALENVVRNAARHARHVTVTARRDGGHAVVEIADDGPGFPSALLPHAFERFRGDAAGGTGLGLAIVRRIAELHGGSAEVANRAEGGAMVRIRLPLARG